jgi:hypothetical protein
MMSTNLWTKFLLQFWKQREDLAILLASNRPQQQWQDKETKKDNGKINTKGKDNQGKTMNKWAYRMLPTYKSWSKIILKMPKVSSKREFLFKKQPLSSL